MIVYGLVVKVIDLKPLAPHGCGFEFRKWLLILSYEVAIQLVYGTYEVLLWHKKNPLKSYYILYCRLMDIPIQTG
jgi:hypothetical protein